MALRISLAAEATNVGAAAPEAYARISSYIFDAASGLTSVSVLIYINQAARVAGKTPIATRSHRGAPAGTVLPESPNGRHGGGYRGISLTLPSLDEINDGVRNTLYTWLKTLPDYAGAVDT
jgi:hypothetical protein